MKILITTDVYNSIINGVAVSVHNLYNSLKEEGHDVRILTLSNHNHSYIENDIYYIGSMPIKIYPDARATFSFNTPVLKDIIEWSPQIIHSQCEFFTFIFARKLARHLNIPIVHTYHTLYEYYTHYFCPNYDLGQKIVSIGSRYICNKSQAVIAPTQKTKNILAGYHVASPIFVIPTGLNLSQFHKELSESDRQQLKATYNIPDNALVLITLGRLAKEKNIDFLIEQMRLLKENHANQLICMNNKTYESIHLVIAGDGPDRSRLESLVNDLNLNNYIHFTGLIGTDDVYRYYKLGHIFVSASNSETQGLTYIEAMACGLPILCLEDECLSSILQPEHNGWFFKDQQSLSRQIISICENPSILSLLNKNALKTAESYSCQTFGQNVLHLYEETITKYHAFPAFHLLKLLNISHAERS